MTREKISLGIMLVLVIAVSILIMVVPTLFTKNISRISSNKEINLPLILNDEKEIKLLFFGYSGCTKICTPRLQAINDLYSSLDEKTKKRVGVEFLDISVPNKTTLPAEFASSFNKEFKGIYLSQEILRDYTKEFKVFFSPSLINKIEFDHTTNLYLVKKSRNKKEIRYIYNSYPYDFKQIKSDIKELLNE
ncbi:MAG: SCO family protein [Sulfurimonas sp.]|jgi:protein SCO1/2